MNKFQNLRVILKNNRLKDIVSLCKYCQTTDQYYPKPTGPTGHDPLNREKKLKPVQNPLPCPSQPCVRDDMVHCDIKRQQCPKPLSKLKPQSMELKSEINPDHPLAYHPDPIKCK